MLENNGGMSYRTVMPSGKVGDSLQTRNDIVANRESEASQLISELGRQIDLNAELTNILESKLNAVLSPIVLGKEKDADDRKPESSSILTGNLHSFINYMAIINRRIEDITSRLVV